MYRTHTNGQLRLSDVGQTVQLVGWVSRKRNLGALVFIDLRDRYGITQIICDEKMESITKEIRNEYVIQVEGVVVERSSKNPHMPTGEIEIEAKTIRIINAAKQPPMIIADETDALEDFRLQYRYLDLRRPHMQQNIILRAKIVKAIHEFLDNEDFIEIETPYLGKSTPEGARDFLVPSRVHPGEFYALPQSPQLFKQMLMVSGFERYYQVARCFRDEDLRADRQIEFTQIDVETSFLSTDEILDIGERMMAYVMKKVKNIDIELPLRRMTWHEAMERYGIDKPDTRFGLELVNLNAVVQDVDFAVFKNALSQGGHVKGINVKGQADHYSRKAIDKLQDLAKTYKAKGLAWMKVKNGKAEGPIVKFFTEEQLSRLCDAMQAEDQDLLLFVADTHYEVVCDALAALRNHLGKELHLYDPNTFDFLWIVDFPMFEYDEETARYYAKHHPFTLPKPGHEDLIASDPAHCLAEAYDIVLNGYELGGGSQRIYDQDMQAKVFNALGFTDESIQAQFGFFVEALKYGTPPHGGFALGLDRIAMILAQEKSLRDVIAFPKNASARCPVSMAPSAVAPEQLEELEIEVSKHE
ncbi:MAG TPA: aspartate--tRNA ligase [Candidatus Fimiplasma intestinipullorum]|uniref:Aspartate--tRNA ligase n=1 Tax=Candidatus Fimiplasma intestinipullorum TaxID=2840825 RepID=A0A9D1HQ21_9FIRM|nr:aspartate--tRNA ligase [Candidatus Fimiplasma intestinipullorum]